MLHITNGDSAVARLRDAGVRGDLLPWRDVLHDGPVPATIPLEDLSRVRARFIADCGWGEFEEIVAEFEARDRTLAAFGQHEEVVLWFEHDLYDQLQLVQLLDWFALRERGRTRLTIVCEAEYIGMASLGRLHQMFDTRREVSPGQFGLARSAWQVFRSGEPTQIEDLLVRGTSELPFLDGALRRHLEQFPSTESGLSRSEAQALAAIANGKRTIRAAFTAASHDVEDPVFLGDGVFVWYLEGLAYGRAPLVRLGPEMSNPLDRTVALTEHGRAVLEGRADRIELNGIDRWLGGVHLAGHTMIWRWDPRLRRLERPM